MTYTLSWMDHAGGLHERSLPLDALLEELPFLHARGTVVGEGGQVCGEVRDRTAPNEAHERWQWYLELEQPGRVPTTLSGRL